MFIGYDDREAVAYHTFCQSILETCSVPVAFTPLVLSSLPGYKETHVDGSNTFIYSRFLTPLLCNFDGWALFADGDMICRRDLAELWALRDPSKAVQVVQHDYQTKASMKYLGNKNQNYPRKNWSSVVLWNCGHAKHRILTPEFVMQQTGAFLHRFSWLSDDDIGALPVEWNWLTTEYPDNDDAKLLHYTLGTPCFKDYKNADMAPIWHEARERSQSGMDV
ncbi:glycosyltransferase [Sphaerotilus mobilis]|uniref:glycosyltransferase n=1 Tax=Sphaerotilus mobilis TaxID=47994 RepID=UPI001F5EB3BE|nr:glycosyltransferase [Sphaerotilus mobilis]